MLELFLLAFYSQGVQGFLARDEFATTLPQIEILQTQKLASQDPRRLAPKLLESEGLSVLAADAQSGKVLFGKDIDIARPIASLTKIMTYLVVRDHYKLDDIVSTPPQATRTFGSQIDIYAHEKFYVRTLLEGMLIGSANDAARALAMNVSETEEDFAELMNQKARELGLDSAVFYNSTGLDLEEGKGKDRKIWGNKMSARDLVQLVRLALRDEFFATTVQQKLFQGTSADGQFFHEKKSTNELLFSFQNVKGVKTGYTELAGQCLVALSQDWQGNEVLTVILGSSDRFGETKKLLTWVWDAFRWR